MKYISFCGWVSHPFRGCVIWAHIAHPAIRQASPRQSEICVLEQRAKTNIEVLLLHNKNKVNLKTSIASYYKKIYVITKGWNYDFANSNFAISRI